MTYFTTEEKWIYDDVTNSRIPTDPDSPQYQAYLDWVALGNTPSFLNTASEADFIKAVDDVLNAEARSKGYDNIISACSYCGVANAFQMESIAFVQWRASVWQHCYQVLADVQSATRTKPTIAELLAELPTYTPPN